VTLLVVKNVGCETRTVGAEKKMLFYNINYVLSFGPSAFRKRKNRKNGRGGVLAKRTKRNNKNRRFGAQRCARVGKTRVQSPTEQTIASSVHVFLW